MQTKLKQAAYSLARNTRLVSWILSRMSFALPVTRLKETSHLLAFRHPAPAYPYHVVLVPKQPIASLAELDPTQPDFLRDLFNVVQQLIAEHNLQQRGYRLIVNGGPYQEFPYLHFHLVSDTPLP